MPDQSQPLHPSNGDRPAARFAESGARRTAADDDYALLGFECANPALQIERWGQESPGLAQVPA